MQRAAQAQLKQSRTQSSATSSSEQPFFHEIEVVLPHIQIEKKPEPEIIETIVIEDDPSSGGDDEVVEITKPVPVVESVGKKERKGRRSIVEEESSTPKKTGNPKSKEESPGNKEESVKRETSRRGGGNQKFSKKDKDSNQKSSLSPEKSQSKPCTRESSVEKSVTVSNENLLLTTEPSVQEEAMLVSENVPTPTAVSPKIPTSEVSKDTSNLCQDSSSVSRTPEPFEIVMVDEETRMSAETGSRAQTPAKQLPDVIEESQSSVQSTATTESGKVINARPIKAPRLEVQEPEGAVISPDQLTEYFWNGNGPFMLQEQVAQFLGIKSFKRKYPNLKRRMLDMQERDFIKESGLASEHMCDLGLTAVNSVDILDIMYSDFQDKYEEYCKHQRDRQAKELINKQRALTLAASQERNKADILKQAMQSAAQWNSTFNKSRKEQRRACMDLQTLTVHYPKGKIKTIDKAKVGNYPISLVPGQFTDFYEEFTPTELNNLPINTMCYNEIRRFGEDSDDSGSDGSDSDSDSSSSSSGSSSDSSSGVEDCKLCKHSPKKLTPKKEQ